MNKAKIHYLVAWHGLACGLQMSKPHEATTKQSKVTCGNCIRYLRSFRPVAKEVKS